MPSIKVVKDGDMVILKNGLDSKVVKIVSNKTVHLWKENFKLDGLIGCVIGTCFKVDRGQLVKLTADEVNSQYNNQNEDDNSDGEDVKCNESTETGVSKDNRELFDSRENQKLTKERIQEMRKTGVSGEEIIDRLIENSSTFSQKTEFSKQKYIRKKSKKHTITFFVLECNTRNLFNMYYCKGPTRICNLRMDSLSQILCQANVRSGGRYLVIDGCLGLVLGSMIERLDGEGLVVNLYIGTSISRPAINLNYQFTDQQLKPLVDYPLYCLNKLSPTTSSCSQHKDNNIDNDPCNNNNNNNNDNNNSSTNNSNNRNKENNDNNNDDNINVDNVCKKDDNVDNKIDKEYYTCNDDDVEGGNDDDDNDYGGDDDDGDHGDDDYDKNRKRKNRGRKLSTEERNRRRAEKQLRLDQAKKMIDEDLFDGLIIAAKVHPTPLLLRLIPFLKPSRPLVVFNAYREPLMDSYMYLKDSGSVLSLKVFESWLRSYQVLPERSHPHVNMSGTGGYILTGLYVCKGD